MGKGSVVDYEINAVSPTDFELVVWTSVSGSLFNLVFEKSRVELARKNLKVGDVGKSPDVMDVPDQFKKLLLTAFSKNLRVISAECKKDGIVLLRWWVKRAVFIKVDGYWIVKLFLEGYYVEKK
jgi:hypothetical protein